MRVKQSKSKSVNKAPENQLCIRLSLICTLLFSGSLISQLSAAENGSLGSTSSATSRITLKILPKTQARRDGQLKFSPSKLNAIESGFCMSNLGAGLYRVKLNGINKNGDFQVSNKFNQLMPIAVAYKHQHGQYHPLKPNRPSKLHVIDTSDLDCKNANLNKLQITFPNRMSEINFADPYHGIITLTVSTE